MRRARCARAAARSRATASPASRRVGAARSQRSSQSRRQAWYFSKVVGECAGQRPGLARIGVARGSAASAAGGRFAAARAGSVPAQRVGRRGGRRAARGRGWRRAPASTNSPGVRKRRLAAMPCRSASVCCSQRRIESCGISTMSGAQPVASAGRARDLGGEQAGEHVEGVAVVEAEVGGVPVHRRHDAGARVATAETATRPPRPLPPALRNRAAAPLRAVGRIAELRQCRFTLRRHSATPRQLSAFSAQPDRPRAHDSRPRPPCA